MDALTSWNDISEGGRGGEGEKESWRGSFSQDKRRYKKSADQY